LAEGSRLVLEKESVHKSQVFKAREEGKMLVR